jgi:hypothetical protein
VALLIIVSLAGPRAGPFSPVRAAACPTAGAVQTASDTALAEATIEIPGAPGYMASMLGAGRAGPCRAVDDNRRTEVGQPQHASAVDARRFVAVGAERDSVCDGWTLRAGLQP